MKKKTGYWIKKGSGSLVVLIFFIVTTILIRAELEKPPPLDVSATIRQALQYDVQIHRDDRGVPHIFGPKDVDVAFGFGFSHAEDDYATIEKSIAVTRGRSASLTGPEGAVTDYLIHLFRVWETVGTKYETGLSAETRAVLEAYARGLNLYAALNPGKTTPSLLPFNGRDIAAGFVFKTALFHGLDRQLRELAGPKRAQPLATNTRQTLKLEDGSRTPAGSNAIALAPSRTSDNHTRLVINSHQPFTGPFAWYEARLKSEEGWNVAGGFFPGSPFMLHGHNARLGWANTVNKPDLVDIYVLTLNPANEYQYRLDGTWRNLERKKAKIRVKLWGPFWWTVSREVLFSEHGPVFRSDHGTYALRVAGMEKIDQSEQYFRLNKAQNMEEWLEAMSMLALPSINYVYADADGHIAYIYNALFPQRKEGWNWRAYLPGDRSDLIWKNYLPFSRVPRIIDPASGFLFNANNTPFVASGPEDNLRPKDFSPTLGIETRMTNRAHRSRELLGDDFSITPEELRNYKFDLAYSPASRVGQLWKTLTQSELKDPGLREAQEHLKQWNLRTDRANRHAALGVLTLQPVIMADIMGTEPPTLTESLEKAVNALLNGFERLDPLWGDVNRLVRGKTDIPLDGGPDIMRAVYGGDPGPDGKSHARAGDTFIMFVDWAPDGTLTSESIHQFGSATLDKTSPHYDDQSILFAGMKMKPVYFSQESLASRTKAIYRPGLLPPPGHVSGKPSPEKKSGKP